MITKFNTNKSFIIFSFSASLNLIFSKLNFFFSKKNLNRKNTETGNNIKKAYLSGSFKA